MIRNIGYEKSRKWAKKTYKKIGRITCPALDNEYVNFTNVGFNHLIRKLKIRSRRDQKKRFAFLIYAEEIIKNPNASIIYRKTEKKIKVKHYGRRIFQTAIVQYWAFVQNIKKWKIKVVIRQVNSGAKHFYSIVGDEIKKSPK